MPQVCVRVGEEGLWSNVYNWCNTGHVYAAACEVQPRKPAHHPPSSLRCVSVRPQQSPSRRAFTKAMAAKVCRSVLLLSRSSGAVAASSLPALLVSSQRHHQHIRPVSPGTCVWLCVCAQGGGVEADRQREPGRGRRAAAVQEEEEKEVLAALAKEVALTSLKIFFPIMSLCWYRWGSGGMSHGMWPSLLYYGCCTLRWDE